MDTQLVALWMQKILDADGCLYQDDVVDFLVQDSNESLLRPNFDGSLVLNSRLLNEFNNLNQYDVVWVAPDKYWRHCVPEDRRNT